MRGRAETVPRGVPGELCIGGAGVAAGYWNDAALTTLKFQPDPYSAVEGARLYRSGDRARWNRQGQLELLGRSDAQFKLRGFRIEPGEIEAAIAVLSGIASAAVATGAGGRRATARHVAEDGEHRVTAAPGSAGHLVPSLFVMPPSCC
jgi:acyl-coenzyme A synthetase/AMP-(fatty) acid ligase